MTSPTATSQVEREADLLRVADERAAETERLGHLHPDVFAALVDCGVLRRWVCGPAGGEGASVTDVLRSIERTSTADGSTGWCVMIANTTALISHRMDPEWATTIFSDPGACTGGFGMPAGRARIVDGGLEVTGHWSWGSGTDHCTWIGGGVLVVDDDGNRARTADGASTPFVFFDPADVELLDTWHVAGMKGTASTDYRVDGAFVPDGRWAQLVGSTPVVDSPLGRFPFFSALAAGVAAVQIGLAERAVAELLALREKRSAGSDRMLAQRTSAQSDLALARANIEQSRTWLHAMTDRAWDEGAGGRDVPEQARAELRLAAAAGARRCLEAVEICYRAAGGAAVYESNPLQRVFRDAQVAQSHGMIAPRMFETLGRFAFGLDTDTRLF